MSGSRIANVIAGVPSHVVRGAMTAGHAGACLVLAGGLLLTCGAVHAAAGATAVPGGSLIVNGTLANTVVTVSGNGILGGNGMIGGDVVLAPNGTVAPGAIGAVGELDGNAFTWQAGGSLAFQLGANNAASDHLVLAGSLVRQGAGSYQFHFSDGAAPPTPGATYTLITFANQSGFSSTDFSYAYSGSLSALIGQFQLSATALTFTVLSTPVELQSFEVD